jgi:hypothetical protein
MKKTFKCEECGKTIEVIDDSIPSCCGKDMKKVSLDICTQPAHAEHSRPMDEENACDDGRAG